MKIFNYVSISNRIYIFRCPLIKVISFLLLLFSATLWFDQNDRLNVKYPSIVDFSACIALRNHGVVLHSVKIFIQLKSNGKLKNRITLTPFSIYLCVHKYTPIVIFISNQPPQFFNFNQMKFYVFKNVSAQGWRENKRIKTATTKVRNIAYKIYFSRRMIFNMVFCCCHFSKQK